MIEIARKVAASAITHVMFAFVAMGGWAVYANSAHPMPKPLLAGLVQGAMSACLTFFLKTAIDRLASHMRPPLAMFLPAAISCSLSAGILATVHWFAGTPEIIRTLAVPVSVATAYGFIYNFLRHGGRSKSNG